MMEHHTPTPPPVSFTEWNQTETARILAREHRTYHRVIRQARSEPHARILFWHDYLAWCERERKTPTNN